MARGPGSCRLQPPLPGASAANRAGACMRPPHVWQVGPTGPPAPALPNVRLVQSTRSPRLHMAHCLVRHEGLLARRRGENHGVVHPAARFALQNGERQPEKMPGGQQSTLALRALLTASRLPYPKVRCDNQESSCTSQSSAALARARSARGGQRQLLDCAYCDAVGNAHCCCLASLDPWLIAPWTDV